MTELSPSIDDLFRDYADQNLRRHQLLSAGKEDSEEVSEAEDRMDSLWLKLDDVQRHSLNGMASDLNWIRRNGAPPPRGRKAPAEVPDTDRQELASAMMAKDWHRTLHFLRLCAPIFQAAALARERSVAYDAIGIPEYARVFSDFFAELTGGCSFAMAKDPAVQCISPPVPGS